MLSNRHRHERLRLVTWVLAVCGVMAGCAQQGAAIKGVADYRAAAAATVDLLDVQSAMERVGDDSVIFIDVREGDEISRHGSIEGAIHVPRGVLEFYIDPNARGHMDEFSSGKTIVFYCATGGRSLLAAKLAQDMGVTDAVSLDGGFTAWARANGPVSE